MLCFTRAVLHVCCASSTCLLETHRREHTALFFTSLAGVFFPATDVHFAEVLVADALCSLSRVFADVAVTFLLVAKGWGVGYPGWVFCYVPCVFASFPYW